MSVKELDNILEQFNRIQLSESNNENNNLNDKGDNNNQNMADLNVNKVCIEALPTYSGEPAT